MHWGTAPGVAPNTTLSNKHDAELNSFVFRMHWLFDATRCVKNRSIVSSQLVERTSKEGTATMGPGVGWFTHEAICLADYIITSGCSWILPNRLPGVCQLACSLAR